nr:SPOR domain-containing protein [Parasulfuritortus cantonensis]
MVFDPEPRPLGDKVDIRIPDQNTAFRAAPVAAPTAAAETAAPEAAGTEPAPAEVASPAPKPEPKPEPKKPVSKPEAKKPEVKKPEPAAAAVKPAAPEAKPVAAEAKPAGTYFLQLGVFSSQANAEQMIAQAKAAGFKASAMRVGSQFKVRVGPIAQRDKAVDYQAKLKAKGLDNVLVEP